MQRIFSATIGLLVILIWADTTSCQTTSWINTFEFNWNLTADKEKDSRISEFSPPRTPKSNYSWVATTFSPCFGCGSKSFKELKHDCIHKLPMQLTVGTFSKALMGVFRVPEGECKAQPAPKPTSALGCGPPCSDLRLLRGAATGCRCDHDRKMAFDVPKLVCQDNRNRTVSLPLCKFFYENNLMEYQAKMCDYALVCTGTVAWIEGNWSQCTLDNWSKHQTRTVVCATQSGDVYYVMHDSMCPAENRPPKMQSCARWTAEKKFICNCYTLKAERRVLCMREAPRAFGRKRRTREPDTECNWHEMPDTERHCDRQQLLSCNRKNYRL